MVFPVAALFVFSLFFAFLLLKTFDYYKPQQVVPTLDENSWITAEKASSDAYFRKQFMLSASPERAYVVISGTGNITTFVNGGLVGTMNNSKTRSIQIFDITRRLQSGRNIMAIRVVSNSVDKQPAVAARIEMYTTNGLRETLKTDTSWRASGLYEYRKNPVASWNDLYYLDIDWPSARLISNSSYGFNDIDSISTYTGAPERIYRIFPGKQSIAARNQGSGATFSREFIVEGHSLFDGWLGVATEEKYTFLINQFLIHSERANSINMYVFDISAYLKPGKNSIAINVASEKKLVQLNAALSITSDLNQVYIEANESWQVLPIPALSAVENSKEPSVFTSAGNGPLLLIKKNINLPLILYIQQFMYWVFTALTVFLFLLGFIAVLHRFIVGNLRGCYSTLTIVPFIWGTILIGALLLVQMDTRFDINALFKPYSIFLIAIAIGVYLILHLYEKRTCIR